MYTSYYSHLSALSQLSLFLIIVIAFLSVIVRWVLLRKFKRYGKITLSTGFTGKQVAEKMLRENGINDVTVTCTKGTLTDHYNPLNKTVNLSPDVYNNASISAAAVAAHECGHAVQHATAYGPLTLRSQLVPIINFAGGRWLGIILLLGVILINIFPALLWIGICILALTTIFSFVTLPVEIDASRRALVWLDQSNVVSSDKEAYQAKDALKWAAYTYVLAAIGALATLFYYLSFALGNSRR